jgi:hypothetical protein
MEKKVLSASVATALAKYDFPVPGGYIKERTLITEVSNIIHIGACDSSGV